MRLSPLMSLTSDCGTSPSWLMLDGKNDILYCLDEGVDLPKGALTSFRTNSNGSLSKVQQLQTMAGPVSSVFYSPTLSPGRKFLAVAHYAGSAVIKYSHDPISGHFNHSQIFTFTLPAPGPIPSRQDTAHPHEVLTDPTGNFLLVPDLGADLVGIFHINPTSGQLEAQQTLPVAPASGPRHAVFWVSEQTNSIRLPSSRFYLVTELDNYLRGISFSQFYEENSYQPESGYQNFEGSIPPAGSKAAEIAISPGNDQLVISKRNDSTFAYGSFPRQFEFSPDQEMVAIALQNSHSASVVHWDKKNAVGPLLAEAPLDGEITAVVWDS
ncbi:Lactonase, 7-bladed beta-propeller-domain-containing protein [Aspergillus cavernicola]|uniref:Lactonase, 7-bladed beta-propeller-domain-containing protein n=1 Tax=Aspergillus cavernicola TaxID=176166 RepID=A0ABR4HUV4_9EURO